MNIYAGTYNGQLYMISGHPTNLSLKRRNQISQNSLRALFLPQNSQQLFCGGFQSQITAIHKYTLTSLKQTKQPRGIINCIHHVKDNIIAVGHQNGLIRFWDCKNWSLKKQLRQHKKPVRDFCVDKNNILFFSVAGKSLILWDTNKYQKVFHYKFDYQTMTYILLINQKQIHQILAKNNDQVAICKFQGIEMIQTVLIYKDFVIIGGDKGNIFIYNLGSYEHKITYQAHKIRVKCMKIQTYDQIDYLVTASTNGQISSWDILEFLKQVEKIQQNYNLEGLQPLSTVNLDRRVLCIETAMIGEKNNEANNTSDKIKEKQIIIKSKQTKKVSNDNKNQKKSQKANHKKHIIVEDDQQVQQVQQTSNKKISDKKLEKLKRIEKNNLKLKKIQKIKKLKQQKFHKKNLKRQ